MRVAIARIGNAYTKDAVAVIPTFPSCTTHNLISSPPSSNFPQIAVSRSTYIGLVAR